MRFVFETRVRTSVEESFRFFSDPGNLVHVLGDVPSFRVLRQSGSVEPGAQTWVETTALGVMPIVLGFEHVEFVKNVRFSEKLIHGPFRLFDHLHEFEGDGETTVIRDILEIALPWQFGGRWTMSAIVRPIVHRMFRVRAENTTRILDREAVAEGSIA